MSAVGFEPGVGCTNLEAAPGCLQWDVRFTDGDAYPDAAQAVVADPAGDRVIVTGHTTLGVFSFGPADFVSIAYDPRDGAELWRATYDSSGGERDYAMAMAMSPDGSRVFVTGQSWQDATQFDIVTVAYDAPTGDELWVARYDGPVSGWDGGRAVGVTPGGETVVVAGFSSDGDPTEDLQVLAYDADTGTLLWSDRFNGQSGGGQVATALVTGPDGDTAYVTGYGGDGKVGYLTLAYDVPTGDRRWTARHDAPSGGALAWAIAVDPEGERVVVTGRSEDNGTGEDVTTVAYDSATGTEEWTARYDAGRDGGRDVVFSPGGDRVYVAGASRSDPITIAYHAATGEEAWVARYEGSPRQGTTADAPLLGRARGHADAIATSPDGTRVYTAGLHDFDFTAVAYNATTGGQQWALRHGEEAERRVNETLHATGGTHWYGAPALAVAPTGEHIYMAGLHDNAFTTLAVNAMEGALAGVGRDPPEANP